MDPEVRSKKIRRTGAITLAMNAFLSVFKLLAGLLAGSAALVSDAANSASDVLSTLIVMFGARLSGKKADEDHNYGHEKLESVTALVLAALLLATAVMIGWGAVNTIIGFSQGQTIEIPGVFALVAAAISIGLKEWMYRFTRKVALDTKSTALMATAWDHRSDVLSTLGSMIGVGGAMLGVPVLDPIASIVIALFIVRVAYRVAREATSQLTDRAADRQTVERMVRIIESVPGVAHVDDLDTRISGSGVCLDVRLSVDASKTVGEAHDISHNVKTALGAQFDNIKSCIVHVNPD